MKQLRVAFSVALVTAGVGLVLISAACHKEGPAEKVGKDIDKAMENTGDTMKDAGKSLGEKVEDAGDRLKDSTTGK
jgi:hypothetical protein